MGFLYELLKVGAQIIGLILFAAGVCGVFGGIWFILESFFNSNEKLAGFFGGIAIIFISIVIATIANFIGRFARGDFDR